MQPSPPCRTTIPERHPLSPAAVRAKSVPHGHRHCATVSTTSAGLILALAAGSRAMFLESDSRRPANSRPGAADCARGLACPARCPAAAAPAPAGPPGQGGFPGWRNKPRPRHLAVEPRQPGWRPSKAGHNPGAVSCSGTKRAGQRRQNSPEQRFHSRPAQPVLPACECSNPPAKLAVRYGPLDQFFGHRVDLLGIHDHVIGLKEAGHASPVDAHFPAADA